MSDFLSLGVTGNSAIAGIPKSTNSCASSNNKSILLRSTPGIEAIASR